jgi:hypothetical protein
MYDVLTEIKHLWKEIDILKSFEIPPYATYGSFYCEDAAIATTITTAGLYYPILSGMITGHVSRMVFQNARELKVLSSGIYKVDWSLSLSVNASDQTIEGMVLSGAAGTTVNLNTVNATRAKENGVVYSVGGTGIIQCVKNELVRLGLENETSSGNIITVNHANIAIVRIK